MNIAKTIKFAEEKHSGQKRKFNNLPYFVHPKKVSEIIYKYKKSHKIDELMKAALLHDVLEDTDTKEKEIEKKFGKLVLSLVKELTSDKKAYTNKKDKKYYLAKKMSDKRRMSSWALVIKLADRFDNISSAIKVKNKNKEAKKFSERYKKETKYILDYLEKHRELSKTQKNLIKAIRNKIK